MKKKSRKKTSVGMISLLALGICAGASLQGAECHTPSGKAAKEKQKSASKVQHEMVPHVVLPETIQYNKIAKSQRLHPGLDSAGDYGMVSPYVATYTPFPSYQVPAATEFRAVNQSVYPVSPKIQAQPLPKKSGSDAKTVTETADEGMVLGEKDSPESDTDVAPILLASGREDVVHATPLSDLDNEVTQTGIFCQKPAKPPAAWSFSSPIFKAASVPMGWGTPGHAGYINQYGPRGCQTQVGFQPPMGGGMQQPGMMPMGMMPPQHTFQMGPGAGDPNGPQVQMLPNGMLMVTMPADHSRCGIFRCRCGNQPRTMFLPAGPGGMPGGMPAPMQQPAMPADPQAMMMQGMMGGMMSQQPQMMPVTAMTPYGAMLVGYRPMPAMNPMMGMGMMQAAYARQMMQAQQQQMAQYMAAMQQAMQQGTPSAAKSEGSADEVSEEPKAPLPINNPMFAGMMPGMMADPYAMYAQQMTGATGQTCEAGQQCDAETMNAQMMNPMMFFSPPMMMPQMQQMMQQPMMGQGHSFAGMYMTPFGMMSIAPTGGMGMNPMMGHGMMQPGMMQPGMMPMTYAGYGQQQPMMQQGGMSMSDVIQLVMLLNNNKPQRRQGLFARFAERREARRERRHGGGMDDPMAQLMQAWSTPYSPADTVLRMPSRNAYPYGQFGAQVGPQDTANYGGFYNLYMGNTTYPGLY